MARAVSHGPRTGAGAQRESRSMQAPARGALVACRAKREWAQAATAVAWPGLAAMRAAPRRASHHPPSQPQPASQPAIPTHGDANRNTDRHTCTAGGCNSPLRYLLEQAPSPKKRIRLAWHGVVGCQMGFRPAWRYF